MRLSFFMLTVTFLHASAEVHSQSVDLELKDVKIQRVFREIQRQSGYDFVFKSQLLKNQKLITLSRSGVEVTEVLNDIIPDHLEYEIINETIVIRRKSPERQVPDIEVQGKVVDESGEGLPGVNIVIKGTQMGTITDFDGNYSISVPDGTVLTFSYVGYQLQEVKVDGRTTIDIVLEQDTTSLDEIVFTGYFVADQESYTGTTSKVEGTELISMGGASLFDNLSLIAPQVQLPLNNTLGSDPNAIPEIRIRGESVLNTNLSSSSLLGDPNLPLFILDNFQVDVQRVIDLDQTRIESVNILIDASATAIYGSRAANGVIIIRTKQPEAGRLLATYNMNLDVDVVDVNSYNLLNGPDLFELQSRLGMREQVRQDGFETREIERLLAAGVDTDWLSQPVQNSFGQRHTLNLQGGTDEIRYSIDGSYINRPGVMKGSGRETYGAALRLIYSPSDRLTFRNSIETNFNDGEDSPYGSFQYYARMPSYLPITYPNGNFTHRYGYEVDNSGNMSYFEDGSSDFFYNPIFEAQVGNFSRSSYTNFINNFELIWDVTDNLRFQSNISLTRQNDVAEIFKSPFSIEFVNAREPENNGRYDYSTTDTRRFNSNATISYTKEVLDGHILTTNLGTTIQENKAQRFGFAAVGYSTANHDPAFSRGYEQDGLPLSLEETQRFVSGFLTLNYNYKGRYLLDGSYNLSGNSSAGANNRFAPFWSIGIGWNLHNEELVPDWIDLFRVTATYGETGSIQFSSYQALTSSTFFSDYRYLGGVGSTLLGLGNSDLRWQNQAERNLTVSYGFLKNRISGQASIYMRNTTDAVTTVSAPPSLGFESFVDNLGEIENKGFEFSIRSQLVRQGDWDVFFNATVQHNEEKILSIGNAFDAFNENASRAGLTPEQYEEAANNNGTYTVTTINEDGSEMRETEQLASLAQDFVVRFEEGGSDEDIYVANSLGIDPMTGEEFFLTPDGEATTDYFQAEIVKAGNTRPDFWGTFGPSIRYKNFNLTTIFTYEYGGQVINQTLINKVENSDKYGNVDRRVLTEGWFQPGDVVPFKSNVSIEGDNVVQTFTNPSSRFVQNNNFIQFSTLNLTYDASRELASKIKLQSLQFSLIFNNLFYSSTVRQERGTTFPFARSMTIGLRGSF